MTQGIDIPGFTEGHFAQFLPDNIDHNTRTIDGMNAFHGMGMIAATIPATENNQRAPRVVVTAEEISVIGSVT